MKLLKLISNRLFSTSAAGLYMILFAVAIGAATFIENDFGTSAAQKVVFKSWWLELLMLMFGITILVNIFRYRLVQQKKWAVLSFHAAIVIIFMGAAVTRYFGFEGMMHIREGSSSNTFLSAETYLIFEARQQGRQYRFNEPVLFASLGNNHFQESYQLGATTIDVEVTDFMPNPKEFLLNDEAGIPTLQIVIGGANGREEYYIQEGQRSRIRGTLFNFTKVEDPQAFNIKVENGQPYFKAPTLFTQTVMATQQRDTLQAGHYHPLKLRSLYASARESFVFGQFTPTGHLKLASANQKMESNSTAGIQIRVSDGKQTQEQYIFGSKGVEGRPRTFLLGDLELSVAYGSRRIQLPFALQLRDFIIEKYPGTNSASSYASEVTLLDERNSIQEDQRIYMNHILNYDGYRFFQSSFDPDELGTYLSVNHDWWGTWISYLGYAVLTIGMVLTFFSRKSRFQQLARNLKQMQSKPSSALVLLPLMLASNLAMASPAPNYVLGPPVSTMHAEKFGRLVMQDHRGRMKPMNTYASEILRKLSRKETIYGLSAEQAIISMTASPKDWYHLPLIKMGRHDKTKALIPVEGKLAAYRDFFDQNGNYILQEHVRKAYNTPKKDRGVFEKEMMKLDERVNICNMVFSGSFFKVFPVPGDPNNLWESPNDAHRHGQQEASFGKKFYDAYVPTIQTALHDGNWDLANRLVDELRQFQYKNGAAVMPSEQKISAEILLNRLNVFSHLGKVYALLGLAFLGLLFARVFKPGLGLKWPVRIAIGIFLAAFAMHTFGLGLRWYVSGRAPWSNGYESMIYIAFTTVLAGILFGRKSLGSLAATSILASTILMVAGLSWLDPEITPLVPVLKSYWLTIHVSLEAGSYGFLMLGALIGLINLVFIIFRTPKNAKNVNRMIREMTQISEMTLIGGLVMVSVGTYLGGVWANESWGRYWGWDAKETWALVTILVYSFILHMRFIPGFRGAYAFNVASLFGWASVIMTYFGVNYYLSGLHSYAAGDPVPIPPFVYYTVICLTVISLLALWRNWQYNKAKMKVDNH